MMAINAENLNVIQPDSDTTFVDWNYVVDLPNVTVVSSENP